MRRFAIPELPEEGEHVVLSPNEAHHLLNVFRHSVGDRLVVFDGRGWEVEAIIVDIDDGRVSLETTSGRREVRPQLPLHLVLAQPKSTALDTALRMAVEIGVTEIHIVHAERSVARSDRSGRWQRILQGAAQQCGRADLPKLHDAATLANVLARIPDDLDRRVFVPGSPCRTRATTGSAMAIGPEGDWSPREVEAFVACGWQLAGLGPWVLRVDTAVVAAAICIQAMK